MILTLLLAAALASSDMAETRILAPAGYSIEHYNGLALSPDSTRVAFVVRRNESRLAVASTHNPSHVRVLDDTKDARNPFWSPDGRTLAFFRWRADGKELFHVNADRRLVSVSHPPDGQERHSLFVLPSSTVVLAEYDVAPDGSRFLVSRALDALIYIGRKRKQ